MDDNYQRREHRENSSRDNLPERSALKAEIQNLIKSISQKTKEETVPEKSKTNQFLQAKTSVYDLNWNEIQKELQSFQKILKVEKPTWNQFSDEKGKEIFSRLKYLRDKWFAFLGDSKNIEENFKIEQAITVSSSYFINCDIKTNLPFGIGFLSEYLSFFKNYHFKIFMKSEPQLRTENLYFYDPLFRINVRALNCSNYRVFKQFVQFQSHQTNSDVFSDQHYQLHLSVLKNKNLPAAKTYMRSFFIKHFIQKSWELFFPVINWLQIGFQFSGPKTILKIVLLCLEYGFYSDDEINDLAKKMLVVSEKLALLEVNFIDQKTKFKGGSLESQWLKIVKKARYCRILVAKIMLQMLVLHLDTEVEKGFADFKGFKNQNLRKFVAFFSGVRPVTTQMFSIEKFKEGEFFSQYSEINTNYLMVKNDFSDQNEKDSDSLDLDHYLKLYLTFIADVESDFFVTSVRSLMPDSLDFYREFYKTIFEKRNKDSSLEKSNIESVKRLAQSSSQLEMSRYLQIGENLSQSCNETLEKLLGVFKKPEIDFEKLKTDFEQMAQEILNQIVFVETKNGFSFFEDSINNSHNLKISKMTCSNKIRSLLFANASKINPDSAKLNMVIQFSFVFRGFLKKLLTFLHLVCKNNLNENSIDNILSHGFSVLIKLCFDNSQALNALFSPENNLHLTFLFKKSPERMYLTLLETFVSKFTFNNFLKNAQFTKIFFTSLNSLLSLLLIKLEIVISHSKSKNEDFVEELLGLFSSIILAETFLKKFLQPCKYKFIKGMKEPSLNEDFDSNRAILFRQEKGKINLKLEIKLANLLNSHIFDILDKYFNYFNDLQVIARTEKNKQLASNGKTTPIDFFHLLEKTIDKLTSMLFHSIKNVYEEQTYKDLVRYIDLWNSRKTSLFEVVQDSETGRKIVYNILRIFGVVKISKRNNLLPCIYDTNLDKAEYDQYDMLDLPKNANEKTCINFEKHGFIEYFLNLQKIGFHEKKVFFLKIHLPMLFKRIQSEKEMLHKVKNDELIKRLEVKILEQLCQENAELLQILELFKSDTEKRNKGVSCQILHQFKTMIAYEFDQELVQESNKKQEIEYAWLSFSEFIRQIDETIDLFFGKGEEISRLRKREIDKMVCLSEKNHQKMKHLRRENMKLVFFVYKLFPEHLREIAIFCNLSRIETTEAHHCLMNEKLGIQMHHIDPDYYQKIKIYEDSEVYGVSVKDSEFESHLSIYKKQSFASKLSHEKQDKISDYETFRKGNFMKMNILHEYTTYKLWMTDPNNNHKIFQPFASSRTKIKTSDERIVNYFIDEINQMEISKSKVEEIFRHYQSDFYLNKKFSILVTLISNLMLTKTDGSRYQKMLYEKFQTEKGLLCFLNLWRLYRGLSFFLMQKPFLVNEYFTIYPSFYIIITFFKTMCEDDFCDFKKLFNEKTEIELIAQLPETEQLKFSSLNSKHTLAQIIYLEILEAVNRSDISRLNKSKVDHRDRPNNFYLYHDILYSFIEFINGGQYRQSWLMEIEFKSLVWMDIVYRVVEQPNDEFYLLKFRVIQFLEASIESQDQEQLNSLSNQISFSSLFETMTKMIAKLFVYCKKKQDNKNGLIPISVIWNWRFSDIDAKKMTILTEKDIEEERDLLADWTKEKKISSTEHTPLKSTRSNPALDLVDDLFAFYYQFEDDFSSHRLLDICVKIKALMMQIGQRINAFQLAIDKYNFLVPKQIESVYNKDSFNSYIRYYYYQWIGDNDNSSKGLLLKKNGISRNEIAIWYFLKRIISSVELSVTTGEEGSEETKILLYNFKLCPLTFFYTDDAKKEFLKQADISSRDAKLQSFNDDFVLTKRKLEFRHNVYRISDKIYYFTNKDLGYWMILLLFLISVAINVLMLLFYNKITNNFDSITNGDASNVILGLNIASIVISGLMLVGWSFKNLIVFFHEMKNKNSTTSKRSGFKNIFVFFYRILPIEHLKHKNMRAFGISLVFGILAQTVSYFFFTIPLFLILYLVPLLLNVIMSTMQNWFKLLILLTVIFAVTNNFAILTMKYFNNSINVPSLFDNQTGMCDTYGVCIVNAFNLGLRLGGGFADTLIESTDLNDNQYFGKYFYSIIFFSTVQMLLIGGFFGIVVDSFKAHQEEAAKRKEDIKKNCFICGLKRQDFEKHGLDFDHHNSQTHNVSLYFSFRYFMTQKRIVDYTGVEIYVQNTLNSLDKNKYMPDRNCREFKVYGIKIEDEKEEN